MILSSSIYGSVSQLSSEKKIELNYMSTSFKMCITDFLLQREKINRVNIEECLNDLSYKADNFEFVLFKYNFKLHLNLIQLIHIKDLLNQAMFSLELQTILERSNISLLSEELDFASF